MFNPMKKKPFMMMLMAGAAGVVLSGTAMAAPMQSMQGTQMYPQAEPVITERYTYTRTEIVPAPTAMEHEALDNDAYYQAANLGTRTNMAAGVVNPDNIRYLSGGIGQDEQRLMKEAESGYSAKVVFADSHGAYLSDVDVTVRDSVGNTVLGLRTDGPVLLLDLKPGTYVLTADDGKEVKTQKLDVSGGMRSHTLHFKADKPLGYDRTAG